MLFFLTFYKLPKAASVCIPLLKLSKLVDNLKEPIYTQYFLQISLEITLAIMRWNYSPYTLNSRDWFSFFGYYCWELFTKLATKTLILNSYKPITVFTTFEFNFFSQVNLTHIIKQWNRKIGKYEKLSDRMRNLVVVRETFYN